MINRSKMAVRSLAAIGLIILSGTTLASNYEFAPDKDVDLCVAEIQAHADYTGAGRVRHEVESSKRRTVGYSLKIETTVYADISGETIRAYKAVCIVTGGTKPLKFTIQKIDDES